MKILLVDDQPLNVYLLKVLLQKQGYEVTSATNGVEAMEKALQDRFDLIVSDILMSGMDGFQLCRKVKAHPQLHNVAFVFYSAIYTDARDQAFALSLGADKFIIKPQDPQVLLAAVQDVLRQYTDEKPVPPMSNVGEGTYIQGHNERLTQNLEKTGLELEETYKRLAESEVQYNALVEQASDAIILFDQYGQVRFANPQFYVAFGYDKGDVPGLHLRDLLFPDEMDRVLSVFQSLMTGERLPAVGEVQYLHKTGAPLYMDMNATLIVGEGSFRGVQAILRDVTVRQNLKTALTSSEQRYRRLFETAHDGILLLNGNSGQITDVNPFLVTLLGLQPDEFLGKELWEIGVFEDRVAAKAAFVTLQQDGYIRYDHLPLVTSDGRHIAVEFVSNVYREGAQPVIQCNIRDITERHKLEMELAQEHEELLRVNLTLTTSYAEIQRFYHTVSHELKTPLTAMREFVAILLDGLAGPLAGQQREYLQIAKDSCDQMTRGLNDLLDTTRADTGKLSIVLLPVDLETVVTHAVAAMALAAQTKGVHLRCIIAPQLPKVMLDAQRITQVLINLLSNALKFTPAGGAVEVDVHPASQHPGWVQLQIRDTGCGIAPEHLEHIFTRLYQVPETDPLSTNGLGLGLYISQELVTLHGSILEVQSQLEHGSTFTFSLPVVEESDSALTPTG